MRLLKITWKSGLLLIGVCGSASFAAGDASDPDPLPANFRKLLPVHKTMGEPRPGDWLTQHPEPGQTYSQYLKSRPVRADAKRGALYIQPLGDYTAAKRKIVDKTARFMGDYFALPVRIREGLDLSVIPAKVRRGPGPLHDEQLLTIYILNEVLKPRLPKDAVALIAITDADLWPGEGWNFVFGQASLADRVGVWSFHRFGDPDKSDADFRLCLLRTMKTATHETGHMFSLPHCTQRECNMNGSNHLGESDRRPLEVCPFCLAKLCHATGAQPAARFEKLRDFCRANGLKEDADFYEKSLAAWKESPQKKSSG